MAKFKVQSYDIRDFLGLLLKLFVIYTVIAQFFLSNQPFLFNLIWGISILLSVFKSNSTINNNNLEE